MFDRLGIPGAIGVLLLAAGVGVVAWRNPIVAGGIAVAIAGLGLIVYGLLKNVLRSFGLGAMQP